jgi:hypothetical protein
LRAEKYGVDVLKTTLDTSIREQLVQYGELVQSVYDNLGQHPCDGAMYGNAVRGPDLLLDYTKGNYSLAKGKGVMQPGHSTYDRGASHVLESQLSQCPGYCRTFLSLRAWCLN